ncbi:nucleotidyltransferase domain-containing protein [Halorhabdus sp. BNX81]|uniref:nucleotidyltransferase domain-containing protein n=1 Tax=Halorhabdus sp. BNX81 TaxID=2980181 RepID=UPI0023DCF334|nr:nucleotidyltransferase domain-containing protein [Halorhabdus sp. BNX81]
MSDRFDQGDGPRRPTDPGPVEPDRLREVLADHPVRVAVLFGSQVTGRIDPTSDVDIVVEFESAVKERTDAFLSLLTDLSVALDRNDLDLALVSDIDPRVGRAAFAHGTVLVGTDDRIERLRERFDERADERRSEEALRERFDRTIENINQLVETGG